MMLECHQPKKRQRCETVEESISNSSNSKESVTDGGRRGEDEEHFEGASTLEKNSTEIAQLPLEEPASGLVKVSAHSKEDLQKTPQSTRSIHQVNWPWIPLNDQKSGRVYYYNALSGESVWKIPVREDGFSKSAESPQGASNSQSQQQPCLATVEAAQQAWQDYWNQWKSIQAAAPGNISPSMIDPSLQQSAGDGNPNLSNEAQRGPALGISEGANVTPSMSIYIEHYKSPTAKDLGRPAKQQTRPPETNVAYTQGMPERI